jgi:alkanesulfonate monooxygenase SsuD/methylene tetrahydromethanopterin reductase-like flavin-dependent oxidoreductase (luciferase family)
MRSATTDHYAAALEMARFAEEHHGYAVVVSEHHGSPDGYLSAPLALVSAMAAATTRIAIQVGALIVPLHDPIELAETMAVIDLISAGRVSYICGAGYRPAEFEMFGQSLEQRGARLEESINVLRQAWTGEPFVYEGRPCVVTPVPQTPGGPMLFLGGGSKAAVRRAVRLGIGMLAERNDGLAEYYRAQCQEAGVEEQLFVEPPRHAVTSAFVADDTDDYWSRIGPYLLAESQAYMSWNEGRTLPESVIAADTVADLRAADSPYRVFTPAEAVDHIRASGSLNMHPLCGGLPPELAWPSLELLATKVLPQLA